MESPSLLKMKNISKLSLLFIFALLVLSIACTKPSSKNSKSELFRLFEEDPNAKPFYATKKEFWVKMGR
jgi:hypothetical protein